MKATAATLPRLLATDVKLRQASHDRVVSGLLPLETGRLRMLEFVEMGIILEYLVLRSASVRVATETRTVPMWIHASRSPQVGTLHRCALSYGQSCIPQD